MKFKIQVLAGFLIASTALGVNAKLLDLDLDIDFKTAKAAPIEAHCELSNASISPSEVVVCTKDKGCFIANADQVDPNKVSLDCNTGDGSCVLVSILRFTDLSPEYFKLMMFYLWTLDSHCDNNNPKTHNPHIMEPALVSKVYRAQHASPNACLIGLFESLFYTLIYIFYCLKFHVLWLGIGLILNLKFNI